MSTMKSKEAEQVFNEGYNCAQAVVLPVAGECSIAETDALRMASVFGAGMGRMQETCGAVTGAFMVIGLKYGFTRPDDQERRAIVLDKTKEFVREFKDAFGTLSCRELLKCNLNTEEGQRKHKEENQRKLICLECVARSARIVEKLIDSRTSNKTGESV
jgi:C_GCAxxG_C_C family probable redox protein